MIEETAVRVEISAARFASQSIFDILRLTVQAKVEDKAKEAAEDAAGFAFRSTKIPYKMYRRLLLCYEFTVHSWKYLRYYHGLHRWVLGRV